MSANCAVIIDNLDDLRNSIGIEMGPSEWLTIQQERINRFAEATGDHQWIHVDQKKAIQGPFGTTIAHGYLTLSLVNTFLPKLIEVRGISMGINYGLNKVRFPAPVPEGARVRAHAELVDVSEVEHGLQSLIFMSIEIEDGTKPACIAEVLSRWIS